MAWRTSRSDVWILVGALVVYGSAYLICAAASEGMVKVPVEAFLLLGPLVNLGWPAQVWGPEPLWTLWGETFLLLILILLFVRTRNAR